MKDKAFLTWLHQRIKHVYGEDPDSDFMHKLRAVIKAMPGDQDTPNVPSDHKNFPTLEANQGYIEPTWRQRLLQLIATPR